MNRSISPIFCSLLAVLLATLPARAAVSELIPADPEAGFHFPYILSIPAGTEARDPRFLVVETNNTGARDDFEETTQRSLDQAAGNGLGPMISRHLKLPLLMPVFPRTKTDWQRYTHALDRDTLRIEEGPLKRIDLQLLAMVADAQQRLAAKDCEVEQRFILCGFSASGSFSNRFAFLHPTRLVAVISGGVNSFPMLPVAQIDGDAFDFPLGVADLEALTGKPFQREAWKTLPQMIFMGALDDNDAVRYDDAYSEQERQRIFQHLGEDMHPRWLKAQSHYLDAGANANLITYGAVGHWTTRQVGMHLISFLEQSLAEAN